MNIQFREDSVLIDGYVNAVARDSKPMRDMEGNLFVEQISPGAFSRALESGTDVLMLLDHDDSRVLGSTSNNLRLVEDSIGLRATALVSDPDVIEKARWHELRGWSFGFVPIRQSEEEISGGSMTRRRVEELELREVSILDESKIPAYDGTSIETRDDGKVTVTRSLESPPTFIDDIMRSHKTDPPDLAEYGRRIEELEKK
ncbi:MAG: HK97 family phage prohead protease [Atopobiaceae bacterium]|jgi:HK97 family phage prohead protease|nr:HK97 family phage prohead protease [Atopobiaceae bacterium]